MESNIRPLAIFASYMLACCALATRCISLLINRKAPHPSDAAKVALFSALAALNLATTWHHMFRYFRWSYLDWAFSRPHPPPQILLGPWLRDTSLFRQAWALTVEAPARSWWSLQIFGFCAVWSIMLAAQARKRHIPHAWAFMMLGQMVAISFASNLFFVAVLLHGVSPTAGDDGHASRGTSKPSSEIWHLALLAPSVAIALVLPDQFGRPGFMPLLLLPHVLAFVPLLVNAMIPAARPVSQPSWPVKLGVMAVIVGTASYRVIVEHGNLSVVFRALHEHPAVSSVGWDAVGCWISYAAWFFLGRD